MNNPWVYEGRVHSPFQIFVRARLTDAELLRHFELVNYRAVQDTSLVGRHAILSDAGEWTMLADDWRYTLWHSSATRPAIRRLAVRYDVFACAEGDCDYSYDFSYYHNGILVRDYAVSSPRFDDRIVSTDFGEPLAAERDFHGTPFQFHIGLKIAATLGIKTTFERKDLRIYAAS